MYFYSKTTTNKFRIKMFYRLPNITQIKRTNLCHFFLCQWEIPDSKIFFDTLLMCRFRNNDHSPLNIPTQNDLRNRFLMGICNTLKQTIRKIPLSVPPLGMNNESTLKRNLKVVCGFWYHLCKKFINNVGLKPLYFWGNEADAISAFALGLAVFDTLKAQDITKMCDMTKN